MYRVSVAALTMICAAVALAPTLASGNPDVGAKGNGLSFAEEVYLERYSAAHEKFGAAAVGANVVDDGTAQHEAYQLPDDLVAKKAEVLGNMLNPPPPPPPAPVSPIEDAASAPYSAPAPAAIAPAPVTSSSGGCPSYMAGEASSPDAVNPSSGAAGCYQVLPSTAAAHGSACADVNSTSCVAAICESSGNGAWSASGATPCDYIGKQ